MTLERAALGRLPWTLLTALSLAYSLAFIDRAIVGLVMDDIGRDLQISRAYTSFLVGSGFAFVYAVVGIAAAVFLSKFHPRHTIAGGILVWSLATIACGLAQSPQLFLIARMVVGAGEATLVPAAYAWIPARVPAKRVGLSIAIFTIGVAVGSGFLMVVGGKMIDLISASLGSEGFHGLASWRVVLLALGVMGLPVAKYVSMVDRAPVGYLAAVAKSSLPDLRAPALVFLGFGCGVGVFYVQIFWAPTFYRDVYEMSVSGSALIVGTAVVLSAVGAIGGGIIGDRLVERNVKLPYTLMMIGMTIVQAVGFLTAFVAPALWISVGAYAIAMIGHGAIGASMGATIAQLFPSDRRSVAASICLALGSTVGLGVVMPLVGMASDRMGTRLAIVAGTATLLILSGTFLFLGRMMWSAANNRHTPVPAEQ